MSQYEETFRRFAGMSSKILFKMDFEFFWSERCNWNKNIQVVEFLLYGGMINHVIVEIEKYY